MCDDGVGECVGCVDCDVFGDGVGIDWVFCIFDGIDYGWEVVCLYVYDFDFWFDGMCGYGYVG